MSIDGQPDAVIDLYAPGNDNWSVPIYTKTFTRPGRHTITISETGERHAFSRGTGLSIDGFQVVVTGAKVTEDGASTVSNEGSGWNRGSQARASGGQLTATSQAGDRASFAFKGKRIEWVGRICPACGEADVYIDGKFATRVDTYGYRGPNVWQTPLFVQSWPKASRHSTEIRAVGTKNFDSTGTAVNLDSYQVRP